MMYLRRNRLTATKTIKPFLAVLATLIILAATFKGKDAGLGDVLFLLRMVSSTKIRLSFTYRYIALLNLIPGIVGIALLCTGNMTAGLFISMTIAMFFIGVITTLDVVSGDARNLK